MLTPQPEQPQEHPPFFLLRFMKTTAAITAAAISAVRRISIRFMPFTYIQIPHSEKAANAVTHAMPVCQTMTPAAHLTPSSRLTAAMAATQGQ